MWNACNLILPITNNDYSVYMYNTFTNWAPGKIQSIVLLNDKMYACLYPSGSINLGDRLHSHILDSSGNIIPWDIISGHWEMMHVWRHRLVQIRYDNHTQSIVYVENDHVESDIRSAVH